MGASHEVGKQVASDFAQAAALTAAGILFGVAGRLPVVGPAVQALAGSFKVVFNAVQRVKLNRDAAKEFGARVQRVNELLVDEDVGLIKVSEHLESGLLQRHLHGIKLLLDAASKILDEMSHTGFLLSMIHGRSVANKLQQVDEDLAHAVEELFHVTNAVALSIQTQTFAVVQDIQEKIEELGGIDAIRRDPSELASALDVSMEDMTAELSQLIKREIHDSMANEFRHFQEQQDAFLACLEDRGIKGDLQRIPLDHVHLHWDDILGGGAQGEVVHGEYRSMPVAVKVINLRRGAAEDRATIRRAFEKEANVLQNLCHKNIVALFGVCFSPDGRGFLVMELAEMTLSDVLHRDPEHGGYALDIPLLFSWLCDMFEAVGFLHDIGMIHRDIKTENLLIMPNATLKLADMGTAKKLGDIGSTLAGPRGTPGYIPPEVDVSAGELPKYSLESDVFSACVVSGETLCNEHPSRGTYPPVALSALDSRIPADFRQLLALGCSENPEDRPAIRTLLQACKESLEQFGGDPRSFRSFGQLLKEARSQAELASAEMQRVQAIVQHEREELREKLRKQLREQLLLELKEKLREKEQRVEQQHRRAEKLREEVREAYAQQQETIRALQLQLQEARAELDKKRNELDADRARINDLCESRRADLLGELQRELEEKQRRQQEELKNQQQAELEAFQAQQRLERESLQLESETAAARSSTFAQTLVTQPGAETVVENSPELDLHGLVAFYHATEGPEWETTWDLDKPTESWFGVTIDPDSKRLIKLELRNNRVTGPLPPEVGHWTALRELDLRENAITAVPAEVQHWTSMTALCLHKNLLRALPPEIKHWTSMTTLGLYDNKLQSLPAEVQHWTNMTTLHLSSNQLHSLPPEVGHWTSMTTLGLYKNQLRSLPAEVQHWTSMKTLYLHENQLQALPAEVQHWTSMAFLNLAGNQLQSLPAEVQHWTSMTRLNLDNNNLDILPPALRNLKELGLNLTFGDNPVEN